MKRSNTALKTAKITPDSPRGSFDGKTPREKASTRAGDRATKPTHGARSASGSHTPAWRLSRFGVVRVIGGPKDLLLDFDRAALPRLRPIWLVLRKVGIRPVFIESYRTRKGWHLWIRLERGIGAGSRVALQSILGSDPRREELNAMRVIAIERNHIRGHWRERWNLLFGGKLTP